MTAARPEHLWQRPFRLAGWPWIELGVTLLTVFSTVLSATLIAMGREFSQPGLLPELILLGTFFVAWSLRAIGHPTASSLLMATSLLLAGIVFADAFAEDVGTLLLPVIAFAIVVSHLHGWPLAAYGAACVVAAGVVTALAEADLRPETAIEVPLLVIGTAGITALVVASIWVVHRQAQSLGAAYADLVARVPAGLVRFSSKAEAIASNPAFDELFTDRARADVLAALLAAGAVDDAGTRSADDGTARTIAGTVEIEDAGRRRVIGYRTRRLDERSGDVVFDSAVVDATAQREASERGALLAALAEGTEDPLLITSPEGVILWSNRAAASVFASVPDAIVGRQVEGLASASAENRHVFRRAVSGERTFEPIRFEVQGEERYFSVTAVLIRDKSGQPTAVALSGRDVTEAQRLARIEGEQEAQLLDGLKIDALTRVIASAADDVSRLAASAERMDARTTSPAALLEIVRAAEAARSLSMYSRHPADPGSAILDDVVSRSERTLRHLVPRRILLQVQLDAPVAVNLSSTEVEEILATLVVNAVEAIPEQGHIWIRTSLDRSASKGGRLAVVEVGDTGSGMNPDVLARAFEPYFTTKAPAIGGGLGLSSVLRLVKDAGGTIDVQSEVHRGTVFQVRLQVPPGEARPLSAGSRPA